MGEGGASAFQLERNMESEIPPCVPKGGHKKWTSRISTIIIIKLIFLRNLYVWDTKLYCLKKIFGCYFQ